MAITIANKKTSKKEKAAIKTSHNVILNLETGSQHIWTGLDTEVQGVSHVVPQVFWKLQLSLSNHPSIQQMEFQNKWNIQRTGRYWTWSQICLHSSLSCPYLMGMMVYYGIIMVYYIWYKWYISIFTLWVYNFLIWKCNVFKTYYTRSQWS